MTRSEARWRLFLEIWGGGNGRGKAGNDRPAKDHKKEDSFTTKDTKDTKKRSEMFFQNFVLFVVKMEFRLEYDVLCIPWWQRCFGPCPVLAHR
jgi:hypothetical protein